MKKNNDSDRMFTDEMIEKATIDPATGPPSFREVGFWHWLEHLLGWNTGQVITWWEPDNKDLMVGFKCDQCGEVSGVHPAREGDPEFSDSNIDWDSHWDEIWPKKSDPEYLKGILKLPEEERRRMIMGDPSIDLPDYCVCRIPERPLINKIYCRECQGKVEEVTVFDLSNYRREYENTPFKARVIGDSSGGAFWVQSIKTGKQYEIYKHQTEQELE